jgi:hypothetical protein
LELVTIRGFQNKGINPVMPAAKKKAKRKAIRRISVRRSSIHGRGVFAAAAIRKGTRIIEYKGRRIKEEVADDKYGDDEGTHTFLFLLENQIVIDANYGGNSSRWINHSCDPNCDAFEAYVHRRNTRHQARRRIDLRLQSDRGRALHAGAETHVRVRLRCAQMPRQHTGQQALTFAYRQNGGKYIAPFVSSA